jgi:hypothetical protein
MLIINLRLFLGVVGQERHKGSRTEPRRGAQFSEGNVITKAQFRTARACLKLLNMVKLIEHVKLTMEEVEILFVVDIGWYSR